MRALAVFLILSSALAGCLAADDLAPESTAAPLLVDALASWDAGEPLANMHLVAEWRNGGGQEADAQAGWLFVDRGSEITILDVRNPANVTEAATFAPRSAVLDVKASDDAQFLFVGDDDEASSPPVGGVARAGGLYAWNVSDKTAPKEVAYLPIGPRRGPHMVEYHRTSAGDELVFGANADVSIARFDRAAGTLTELSRYSPDLVTGFNRDPNVVDVLYQGWAHDMFAMEDAGRTLLYVANWDAGLRIVDVTDPEAPVEIGAWMDFPEGHAGNLHTVATEWIGDRRITVGSVEVGYAVVGGVPYALGAEPPVVYVWDTTDPAAIALLGTWQNPDGAPAGRDVVPGEVVTTTHNFQLEGGRVYLAHNALGVFVLDVSTPATQAAPATLAYYREDASDTWDVVLHEGSMLTSGAEGVLALHYPLDVVGERGVTSRA